MSVLLVTGTGTDVGKTVATAAIAGLAAAERGRRIAVVKPAQTGVEPGAPGDLAEVTRLAGVTDVHEFARYPDPLSPHHAAMVSGLPALDFAATAQRIDDLDAEYDTVLVEGAGGLLVPFDSDRAWTMIDLAHHLNAPLVVVTAPGLGTLNHTALTVERIAEESLELAGIVVGSWPAQPDLAMELNLYDLRAMSPRRELGGVLPAGLGAVRNGREFRTRARAALAPRFGGTLDWRAFRETLHV
ncbi:dethiobiotin synthetase [Jatrophihabitans endophyticus]|uniref:ATP-dependent dethiobiotin synthetase BioD n=1 Tax=Jatrophihabitans endophyticus TaxID=1206085 RepID=A0A1M5T2B9_9ACTN|nr:dethiobiotin synthase [Jatrophihabitans endophyticus]SHH44836.1 dethiobiotin synthetase [Jatrophihabitans endophyticus]